MKTHVIYSGQCLNWSETFD